MSKLGIKKNTRSNAITYLIVIVAFVLFTILSNGGVLGRKTVGLLVPACCYIVMAISLNLTVGILGELSLGHAGFMSVGAFAGVVASTGLSYRYSRSSSARRLPCHRNTCFR